MSLSEIPEIIWFLIRRAFCHHKWTFWRNLYGDQIIDAGYKRSMWSCSKCGGVQCRDELHGK